MTDYIVTGRAMTLSVETSRACGHLVGIEGEETPDGRDSYAARSKVKREAIRSVESGIESLLRLR